MKRVIIIIVLIASQAGAEGFFSGLGSTFVDAFDSKGLIILGTGVVATAIAYNQDQSMRDAWVNNQRMSKDISGFGNFWGSGIPEAALAGGQLIFDSEKGVTHVESLLASTLVAYGLKFSVGRQRPPTSEDKTSFPSGHSQASFTTATHLTYAYGWGVGIPAFGLAMVTGLSRLADNAHWLSDVVAGATIGVIFGRSAFKHHLTISPFSYENNGRGLKITYNF